MEEIRDMCEAARPAVLRAQVRLVRDRVVWTRGKIAR